MGFTTEGQRLEAVRIWQRASKLHRDGGDVTFNQLKAVLEAADYWKLRKAAKQALEDITAYRRLSSIVPADVPDGPTEKALRAALKGGGESQLPLTEVRGLQLTTPANGPE